MKRMLPREKLDWWKYSLSTRNWTDERILCY